MLTRRLSEEDLRRELSEWRDRYPFLKEDALFLAWFMRAFVTESEEDAAQSLTGGSKDKDADAVFIDHHAKIVFIVQGKYRKNVWDKAESRTDVKSFADLAIDLCGADDFFQTRLTATSPTVRDRLVEVRKRIRERGYRLQLHYVTLGKVTRNVRDEGHSIVRRFGDVASIDFFDGQQVLLMLADYLDGVAPPVPSLDLPMEGGDGGGTSGALCRQDNETGIESWVFSMRADAVACIFEQAGTRLFARNVRGFLGDTNINSSMQATLTKEPEYFWYYNNGITIICDQAERRTSSGRDALRVTNPQVINGQQTTRVLYLIGEKARGASVLVRVIRVPRESGNQSNGFEMLVSNIVQATNWQNAIRPSDLMSNDRRQIEIERQLRKIGCLYVRKRQTKGEARRASAAAYHFIVKKEEFAQAVAACELDPFIIREGKEKLFEERWYSTVFPTANPYFYLTRYWTMRSVSYVSKGYPERAYAKWLVLNFLWPHMSSQLRSKSQAKTFQRVWLQKEYPLKSLSRAINAIFRGAMSYYRAERGKGATAQDISTFFKRRGLHKEFAKFWRGGSNKSRSAFAHAWARFEKELRNGADE